MTLRSAASVFTAVPSIAVITSPWWRPAPDAGPEDTTVVTRTPAGSVEVVTPTPRNAGVALAEPLPPLPFPPELPLLPFPSPFRPLLPPFPPPPNGLGRLPLP